MPNNGGRDNKSPSEQAGNALTRLREHETALKEIAGTNAPDAHVARVLLALARDENPNPADVEQLSPDGFSQK
jgi:hypothetical protein